MSVSDQRKFKAQQQRDPNFVESKPDLPVGQCWYFGCWRDTGHFLWTPTHRSLPYKELPPDFPMQLHQLDAGLCDNTYREQREGFTKLHHLKRFTIISFWDRTVDDRPGSNSAFIIRGEYSFADTLQIAKAQFPEVYERITKRFPIVEIK